jgi:hypothetical protein
MAASVAGFADLLILLAMAFSNQLFIVRQMRLLTPTLGTVIPSSSIAFQISILSCIKSADSLNVTLLALRACGRIGRAVYRRGKGQQRGDQDGKDAELHRE